MVSSSKSIFWLIKVRISKQITFVGVARFGGWEGRSGGRPERYKLNYPLRVFGPLGKNNDRSRELATLANSNDYVPPIFLKV